MAAMTSFHKTKCCHLLCNHEVSLIVHSYLFSLRAVWFTGLWHRCERLIRTSIVILTSATAWLVSSPTTEHLSSTSTQARLVWPGHSTVTSPGVDPSGTSMSLHTMSRTHFSRLSLVMRRSVCGQKTSTIMHRSLIVIVSSGTFQSTRELVSCCWCFEYRHRFGFHMIVSFQFDVVEFVKHLLHVIFYLFSHFLYLVAITQNIDDTGWHDVLLRNCSLTLC